jgi:hypothetical protein
MRRIAVAAGLLLLCALALAPAAGARRVLDYRVVSAEGRFTESWVHDEFMNDEQTCDWTMRVAMEYTLNRREAGTALLLFSDGGIPPHYEVGANLRFRIVNSNITATNCEEATSCSGRARQGADHIDAHGDGRPIRMRWDGVPTFRDPDFRCFGEDPDLYIFADERQPKNYSIERLSRDRVVFTIDGADTASESNPIFEGGLTFGFAESSEASWSWTIELRRVGALTADAGGPYNVVRGKRLRLDGSRSSPRERIDSYRWTFQRVARDNDPGPPVNPSSAGWRRTRAAQDGGCKTQQGDKRGKTPKVQPLCTIKATLTVRDGGQTDSDTTKITVEPRDWQTPVADSQPEHYTRWRQPQHGTPDGSTFGLNVPGCGGGARSTRDSYFCPLPDGESWFGDGYTLDVVDDPKGPHDGDWYIKARPKFEIRRRQLVNAYMYPGAGVPAGSSAPKEFYAANRDAGFPIDDFIRYVENHEGPGQGIPRSGHTQAIVEAIRGAPDRNDPQRVIEGVVEKNERAAREEADKRLRGAGKRVCLNTRDPLAGPWTGGNPYAWDPTFQNFAPLGGADFEGDPRDCAG